MKKKYDTSDDVKILIYSSNVSNSGNRGKPSSTSHMVPHWFENVHKCADMFHRSKSLQVLHPYISTWFVHTGQNKYGPWRGNSDGWQLVGFQMGREWEEWTWELGSSWAEPTKEENGTVWRDVNSLILIPITPVFEPRGEAVLIALLFNFSLSVLIMNLWESLLTSLFMLLAFSSEMK